jgi:hypothetical protein
MFHKVIGRPIIVYNTVIFNILVFGFFYVAYCLCFEISCLDLSRFTTFLLDNKPSFYFLLLAVLTTFFVLKISTKINALYYLVIIFNLSLVVQSNFDKLVLVLIFVLAGFSFYFALFWGRELSESYHNSNFDVWDLNERKAEDLKVLITQNDSDITEGIITNWSGSGCYVRFNSPVDKIKNKKVNLKITFSGKSFDQSGRPVISTRGGYGCGFIFSSERTSDLYNWNHLYAILYDRSYLPEYLM